MALRTFTDRDGVQWNAWHVVPTGTLMGYPERFRDGWVCFEKVGGGGRSRVPLSEIPDDWATMPADRLDLLRRAAENSGSTGVTARASDDMHE